MVTVKYKVNSKVTQNRKLRSCEVTGEQKSTYFLLQSIAMAVQRGNAACVIGTAPASTGLEGIFDFSLMRVRT